MWETLTLLIELVIAFALFAERHDLALDAVLLPRDVQHVLHALQLRRVDLMASKR